MILVRIILPPVCCCLRFSFRSEYSLFVPYPGQTNAFTLIMNVNEQVDIYINTLSKVQSHSSMIELKKENKLTWKYL